MTDLEFAALSTCIHKLTKIDLGCYKPQQMRRRLDSFVASQGMPVRSYFALLEQDPRVLDKLRGFLTINVSEFFRDTDQFDILRSHVLSDLVGQTPSINVWSAGCSIGAEPYTVAIMLNELTPRASHRILGTDLDSQALATARAGGPYSAADIRNVNKALAMKYFTMVDGQWWIKESIREKVQFRQQNLLTDRFEQGFDLTLCRKVVIYFSEETKVTLNEKFSRALKTDGWLFIGGAEGLFHAAEQGFERRFASLYQKRAAQLRSAA